MSSTALKTLAVVLVVAAAILGFVAYQFSQGLTQPGQTTVQEQQKRPQPGEDQVLAVVAVNKVPAYEPIKKEDVGLVPISVEPPQYFTDVGEVVGRTPLRTISVGTPVTNRAFGSANTLARAIPPGSQAMSLEISDVIAVGGFVKPGDMVDVLIYLRASGQAIEKSQSRVLLKKARVLGYEERLINAEPKGGDDERRQSRRQRTAVLAVPEGDTTRVMLGASVGDLRLALRGSDKSDQAQAETVAAENGRDGNTGSGDEPAPEALSPEAQKNAAGGDSKNDEPESDEEGKPEEEKSEDEKEKVITLEELAEIKDAQDEEEDTGRRQRPPGTVIEVYQGSQSSRIRRPY